jgi:hypothetical protein
LKSVALDLWISLESGHIIFLGAFYIVLTTVAATLVAAARARARDPARPSRRTDRLARRFSRAAGRDRVCRHVLTGEFKSRECPHAFDCRQCETHAKLIARHPLPRVEEPEEDSSAWRFRSTAFIIAATPGRIPRTMAR